MSPIFIPPKKSTKSTLAINPNGDTVTFAITALSGNNSININQANFPSLPVNATAVLLTYVFNYVYNSSAIPAVGDGIQFNALTANGTNLLANLNIFPQYIGLSSPAINTFNALTRGTANNFIMDFYENSVNGSPPGFTLYDPIPTTVTIAWTLVETGAINLTSPNTSAFQIVLDGWIA